MSPRQHSSLVLMTAVTACLLAGCGRPEPAEPAAAVPQACEALAAYSVSDTIITSSQIVPAGTFEPSGPPLPGPVADYSSLSDFCRVTGSIQPSAESDIRFELWLPASNWNGRFLQTGNGGAAGVMMYASMVEPLRRGYAVAHTDTGHRGQGGDYSWAAGQPERLIDYQYRAVKLLTQVGKTLTAAHFGMPPQKSYWAGCSTGGRQGLLEAQRFPGDYDAVIAGAPANDWLPLMALSIHIQNNLGPAGLPVEKLGLLREAAITACDANDGVTDRVITEPARCDFDPAELTCAGAETDNCLQTGEIDAARRIYAGVTDAGGTVVMPGTGPGSEGQWAWYASPQFRIGSSYFRHVIMNDATWDPGTFDVDRDLAIAEELDMGAIGATDPDLSAFIARGGKLLIYHGTTDGLIPYGSAERYYRSVVEELGAEAIMESIRYYQVPGMDHCAGGEGAYVVDWLSAMENWVEEGAMPEILEASHPASDTGEPFTRPLCAYPGIPRYSGAGDTADAANFFCGEPSPPAP